MKTFATFALAVTVAVAGLAASEEPPAPSKTAAAKADEAKAAQAKAAENESPLVRAARLSSRKGKKPTNVITNKTLKDRGRNAHITTTSVQRPLPNIPVTPVTQAKVIEVPKSEPPTDAQKKTLAEAIEAIDDPYAEIDDPAVAERMAAEAAKAAAEGAPKNAPPAEKPPAR